MQRYLIATATGILVLTLGGCAVTPVDGSQRHHRHDGWDKKDWKDDGDNDRRNWDRNRNNDRTRWGYKSNHDYDGGHDEDHDNDHDEHGNWRSDRDDHR